ncbi:bifunctional molybdenum cofactor biosynthesis protein MoaC/MoaB [Algoriphagus halophytocola]|uniref:Molybdopterin adenylyltransferase n=1 Tax=Algoriphagus halophytocola TaxID=2991499 RepID=A0ABY6MGN8_9BACT|nr:MULTISPECIES: bifunctional molybdenum cofactor biosynthesis protein MoaC/MoaB [unclassified Algoriphagus]UZD21491.1 bifunctional molybdenum cofactor biosynthesis protein MoaC/MoaB [Algoriphagus sp. TR-M5]WBL42703.1 bifunctional molybdenum cofactor biosynthesis protein MoaC/MoaB [Algoriphagus sp. TR-M9]
MVDITHKVTTLRTAKAKAIVQVSLEETIAAVVENRVPKGNVFEMAKVAGLFAVKNTHITIPDCHPLPVEYTAVEYEIEGLEIHIYITVKTVYKTGVEVEAMHGASVIALTMYDMLKPIDKGIVIREIGLVKKTGGKSSFKDRNEKQVQAAVVVCSDSISKGIKEDKAGKAIVDKLEIHGVKTSSYEVIPDDLEQIRTKAFELSEKNQLVIFTGGTGLSKRDVTPEALEPILERRIPGVEEAIRSYGQKMMPFAMLSRSVAGTIGDSIILALPGSTNGAKESMDAVFPHLLHVFQILKGANHDPIG